jgi:hypothetical protein
MGTFWDAIKPELDALDAPTALSRRPGVTFGAELPVFDAFGADYDSDPATVKKVQQAINAAGYSPQLAVDGSYGPLTKAGVQWLQSQKGLTADGVIGPATLAVLGIAAPAGGASGGAPLARANVPPIAGLRDVVGQVFGAFSTKFEGFTPYLYADSKGYVTTGIGNKVDPIGAALALPWKRSDGSPASQQEITDAWNAVKNAYPGVQSTASQSLTSIRLDHDGIAQLVNGTLANFVGTLRKEYPNFDQLPAAAQLALASLAWAWGPAFATVHTTLFGQPFIDAITSQDFQRASDIMMAGSAHEESINAGIIPRNKANRELFAEAANVVAASGDFDSLSWPSAMLVPQSPLHVLASAMQNKKRTLGLAALALAFVGGLFALLYPRAKALPPRRA